MRMRVIWAFLGFAWTRSRHGSISMTGCMPNQITMPGKTVVSAEVLEDGTRFAFLDELDRLGVFSNE